MTNQLDPIIRSHLEEIESLIIKPTGNLRWLEITGPRGTERILQQEFISMSGDVSWKDVEVKKE